METRLPPLSSPVCFTLPTCNTALVDIQAEGNKSATQKVGDATRSGGDSAQNQGQGILGSAQETLGNAAQSVQDAVSGNKK